MGTKDKVDLIIIGSGPGGYVAAVRAARLKMEVICIEKAPRLGGVCLNIGCIPSKALLDSSEWYHLAKNQFSEHGVTIGDIQLNLSAMMARKEKVVETLTQSVRSLLERHKISIVHGTASLEGQHSVKVVDDNGEESRFEADNILLATGSEPIQIPAFPFDGERIISSTEALSLDNVPGHLGIVGGGYIGLELGSVWQRLGAKITVIEMLPSITTTLDGQITRTLQRLLTRQGLEFRLKTEVTAATVENDKVHVTLSGEKKETLSFDRLLVAVGRRPLTRGLELENAGVKTDEKTGQVIVNESYETSVPGIYAIGDLTPGPMLAHKAMAEGTAAVEAIAGLPGEVNYDAIPAVVYTWPEVACVGLTEATVKERNIEYRTGVFPFTGTGRALCMGESSGFVKMIAHAKTDRILGIHIIGPRASELIAEGVMAMEFGASSEDIARIVHSHPTLSEAMQEAAAAAMT